MNILNIISKLDSTDVIILLSIVVIILFLIIFSGILVKKNKDLKNKLEDDEEDIDIDSLINNGDFLEDEEENTDSEDVKVVEHLPSTSIEEDTKKEDLFLEDEIADSFLEEIKEPESINEILEDLPEIEETGPYRKNILRELSSKNQTSPVNIGRTTVEIPKVKVTSYVKKEVKEEHPKLDSSTIPTREKKYEQKRKEESNSNKEYIEELSRMMEEENVPDTIELTDYEKKQEEEAIISYKELIKNKDKIQEHNDDEEIDSFIDKLKDFRDDL